MTVLMMTHLGLEWLNEAYFYCMDKYWPEAKNILSAENSFKNISHIRPPQSDNPGGIPNTSWVDALHWSLNKIDDEFVIYMHPDYLLYDKPNIKALEYAENYIINHENVLRINIGADYGYAKRGIVIDEFNGIQIKECENENRDCFHPVSLTPGIWRKSLLMDLCDCGAGHSSWNLEEIGIKKFLTTHAHLRSLAVVPEPIKFSNAIYARNNNHLVVHPNILEKVKETIPVGSNIEVYDK